MLIQTICFVLIATPFFINPLFQGSVVAYAASCPTASFPKFLGGSDSDTYIFQIDSFTDSITGNDHLAAVGYTLDKNLLGGKKIDSPRPVVVKYD